jgi:hypothetical protein
MQAIQNNINKPNRHHFITLEVNSTITTLEPSMHQHNAYFLQKRRERRGGGTADDAFYEMSHTWTPGLGESPTYSNDFVVSLRF